MAVREPFAFGPPRRYSLSRLTRDANADWTQDSLGWVDEKVVAEELGPYLTGLDIAVRSGTVIGSAHEGTSTR
jgi:hypothetical protein